MPSRAEVPLAQRRIFGFDIGSHRCVVGVAPSGVRLDRLDRKTLDPMHEIPQHGSHQNRLTGPSRAYDQNIEVFVVALRVVRPRLSAHALKVVVHVALGMPVYFDRVDDAPREMLRTPADREEEPWTRWEEGTPRETY